MAKPLCFTQLEGNTTDS